MVTIRFLIIVNYTKDFLSIKLMIKQMLLEAFKGSLNDIFDDEPRLFNDLLDSHLTSDDGARHLPNPYAVLIYRL